MQAKENSFTFMSSVGLAEIPFFQRTYVWDEENWDDLLEDLIKSDKDQFLGSLILKLVPKPLGDPNEVLVIDGQQRLTTLSILLKAIFDLFSEAVKNDCQSTIRQYLFSKKQATSAKYFVKIKHSRLDFEVYESIIRLGLDDDSTQIIDKPDHKIYKCYFHYINKLNNMSEEVREQLFNRIANPNNKMLVVIELSPTDDEQAIFDTINSAGIRLSHSDTIKNALFQKFMQFDDDQNSAVELYERTWERAFQSPESYDYWTST